VIASTVTPHAVIAQTRPLVIGEREMDLSTFEPTPPPAVGIGTTTPQAGVDVAGDVIVDGRLYVMRHETTASDPTDDAVAWLTTLSSGQHRWMATRPSPVVDTDGQSRIQIDTPQLAIGYAAGGSPAADTRLDVDGRAYVWHESGDAPVYLDDLRHDSAPVGDLDPTSSIPEECVALSLDAQGHVVLVNLCTLSAPSPSHTYQWNVGRWFEQVDAWSAVQTPLLREPEAIIVLPDKTDVADLPTLDVASLPRIRCNRPLLTTPASELVCGADDGFVSLTSPGTLSAIVALPGTPPVLDGTDELGTSYVDGGVLDTHYQWYSMRLGFSECTTA
jgi:hypothetical protein